MDGPCGRSWFLAVVAIVAACSTAPTMAPSVATSAGPELPSIETAALGHELERYRALAYPGPDFYTVPDPLPEAAPGKLIRLQPVAVTATARAYRVLYHSGSVDGTTDVAVSGLIWVPGARPPEGGFPILAYGPSYSGSGDACPPSGSVESGDDPIFRDGALARGYVVAITDYEGRGTRYPYRTAIPESESHSLLDAARAARDLLGPDASDRVAVAGYSIGGDSATATLLDGPGYAPELDVRAVVSFDGGVDHRTAVAGANEAEVIPSAYVEAVLAYAEAYGLDAADILTPSARRDAAAISETGCVDFREAFGDRPATDVLAGNPLDLPDWRRWVEAHTLRAAPYPLLLIVAGIDNTDRVEGLGMVAARLCANGDDVELRELPEVDHDGLLAAAGMDALDWMDQRMAGLAMDGCQEGASADVR